jgi:hypothetical protein
MEATHLVVDVAELGIPVGMLGSLQHLGVGLQGVVEAVQDLAHPLV